VTLLKEDLAPPGILKIAVENPDTRGIRSNEIVLEVSEEIRAEELAGPLYRNPALETRELPRSPALERLRNRSQSLMATRSRSHSGKST
jgi:hypothetical protein